MSGLNPDFSDDAVRSRILQETAGLPPEARPGSATQMRAETIRAQTGLRGLEAVRNHSKPDEVEPDSI